MDTAFSSVDKFLEIYPEAKKFVELTEDFGIKHTFLSIVSVVPANEALSYLAAWVLYPAISCFGEEAVLNYPQEMNEYYCILRLYHSAFGNEYAYKLLQAYLTSEAHFINLINLAHDMSIDDKTLSDRVLDLLKPVELEEHIVEENDETLLDITDFENPHSELYSWCHKKA